MAHMDPITDQKKCDHPQPTQCREMTRTRDLGEEGASWPMPGWTDDDTRDLIP